MRYNMNRLGVIKTLLASALLVALLTACGTADNGPNEGLEADAFVGAVDEDLFIGILVAPHPPEQAQKDIVVYLCDGADVSMWLYGETLSDSIVLENANARVELSLGDGTVSGTVELGDIAPQQFPQYGPYEFAAELATGGAGLYRAEETFAAQDLETQDYVGGWVVLNNLEQRGAITLGGQVLENPTLDVTTGQAQTSVGTFSTVRCFRNPRTGERICVALN